MPMGAYMAAGILFEGKETLVDGVDDPQTRFQALHHQFVASAKAVKLGHEINPDFQIGCMVAFMTTYPNTCNPDDMLLAQKKDQISNMICGDVQVRGAYPGFAKRFFAKKVSRSRCNRETSRLCVKVRRLLFLQLLHVSG